MPVTMSSLRASWGGVAGGSGPTHRWCAGFEEVGPPAASQVGEIRLERVERRGEPQATTRAGDGVRMARQVAAGLRRPSSAAAAGRVSAGSGTIRLVGDAEDRCCARVEDVVNRVAEDPAPESGASSGADDHQLCVELQRDGADDVGSATVP